MKADLILQAHAGLGEGPVWDEQTGRLYWLDILAGEIHRFDPLSGRDQVFNAGRHVGALALAEDGGLLLATADGFGRFDLAAETFLPLGDPEADRPGSRFNDGACDPAGRFWAGTMAYDLTAGAGALYRLDPDGSIHKMVDGLTIANGLAWSLDHQTMYHIDTIPRTVTAYDYDLASGEISRGRVAISAPEEYGYPDGMAIDREGMLWIAHFNGGCVRRWNPHTAAVLAQIDLPTPQVTSCAFGGPDLDLLYITTAAENMTPAQKEADPLAGSLFAAKPGVQGLPCFRVKSKK